MQRSADRRSKLQRISEVNGRLFELLAVYEDLVIHLLRATANENPLVGPPHALTLRKQPGSTPNTP